MTIYYDTLAMKMRRTESMRFACLKHQQNQTTCNSESLDQNVYSGPVFLHNQQNFLLPRLHGFLSLWMIFETYFFVFFQNNFKRDKDKKLWDQD